MWLQIYILVHVSREKNTMNMVGLNNKAYGIQKLAYKKHTF